MLESWREKRKDRSESNSTRTGIRSHATRKKIISRYIDLQIYTYTHMYAQVNRLNVIKYRRSVSVKRSYAEYEEGQFPANNRIKLNVTKENWGDNRPWFQLWKKEGSTFAI